MFGFCILQTPQQAGRRLNATVPAVPLGPCHAAMAEPGAPIGSWAYAAAGANTDPSQLLLAMAQSGDQQRPSKKY